MPISFSINVRGSSFFCFRPFKKNFKKIKISGKSFGPAPVSSFSRLRFEPTTEKCEKNRLHRKKSGLKKSETRDTERKKEWTQRDWRERKMSACVSERERKKCLCISSGDGVIVGGRGRKR